MKQISGLVWWTVGTVALVAVGLAVINRVAARSTMVKSFLGYA